MKKLWVIRGTMTALAAAFILIGVLRGGAGTGDAESGKYLPSVHWDRIKDEQD